MGIVKIDDGLHEEVRRASAVMERSINAQAAFWIRIGMLAEANPGKSYSQLIEERMKAAQAQTQEGGE
ncbi:MAG: ParD-like family protein [Pseudomonadota bacterium]